MNDETRRQVPEMHVEIVRGDRVFKSLASEWDSLVDRAMTATPFQKLGYQKAWWTHLGPGELYTIVLRDPAQNLCAVCCLYLLEDILYFNGCVEETDYLDLIVPEHAARQAWTLVFDTLESDQFPRWQGLSLCNIPEQSPSREILADLARARGYTVQSRVQDVCPIILLPDTFDDYLMALDKKQRHEIRRKIRRASAASTELHVVASDETLDSAVEDFLRLLQLSTTEKEGWLNEGRRRVFHEVAAEAQDQGNLQLLFLRQGTRNIAALFNFDYKGRIWVYNSGMDIVEFGKLSPGVVLTAAAIELAIEAGRHTFDFLRGDEEYKYRFGARDTHIYHLQLDRP